MEKKQKSILDEALLDMKIIQEALQGNTKEILTSIAKEEINGLVKESLNEEDFEEEDVETETDSTEDNEENLETEISDLESVENGNDETSEITNDVITTPEENDQKSIGDNVMDTNVSDLGNEIDMTSASDEDVIAVYKKLSGEDEIQVVGNDIHLNVSEPGEYVIKNATNSTDNIEPIATEPEVSTSNELGLDNDDETEYEIEMDSTSDDIESELEPVATEDDENSEEMEELDENLGATRGYAGKQGAAKSGAAHNPKPLDESIKNNSKLLKETTEKYNKLLVEAKAIKKENEEFRTSLNKFREMLTETVVFNSNLTYVTKLFVEHSTTADEKKTILKRFDEEVSNLQESKKLYKTIKNELTTKKNNVVESIDKKINNTVQSSSSKQLNESTVYIDESTERIKDLFKRVEKR